MIEHRRSYRSTTLLERGTAVFDQFTSAVAPHFFLLIFSLLVVALITAR
jgi:hypothetical protein